LFLADENDRFLLCRIGSRIAALALRDVKETMRPLPVEPLPRAPPFVLGLATVRGSPTPVVDVGRILGPSAPTDTPAFAPSSARFVSIKLGERTAALSVDAVLDVRSLPSGILVSMPPLLREAGASVASVVGSLDTTLLLVLEAARLVPESAWTAIESSGVTA
jgi:purine-binding chemotaxis protein CheW